MINRVILVGRITKDPELRFINNDTPLVKFVLAVNRNYIGTSGQRETDFIRCSVWNKQAENLAKYISKGALLGIEGSIRVSTYESNNQKQFLTEINCDSVQFLESKKNSNKVNNMFDNNPNETQDEENNKEIITINNLDEDLPF
ncbi:MAG: single-stranded DNA-binding protein [Candidatus Phytoplasma stylosanthis]|uniref:single-stranded DNA-binding protein n=1 Tax=Candidatus Phytoplasma stylosanthis TaxID=2798314 RepID=UPI00293A4BFD|nr:single-stranded DNA-binding protein [Candidatus Phytoplasma stylosanthis]MDV3167908.1 single-stranded DNA-binding protein [Candidatus Phytoplasma stylosanthis]MDV3170743.1 single-stranded DNA-binding protein [Candidatus Phytoplasma stylosanthis]MDV3173613.1 single-stranded DNA-binding protein [Candidatus Phytoplasma stylosanthis]MDV3174000.1 single-stranded DNA-binding protein [Candidatus Phytoplasma stylosanthis]MDV3196123.1 single-stranded DNA-binding protein [Candidatus Phytoplasma stylo